MDNIPNRLKKVLRPYLSREDRSKRIYMTTYTYLPSSGTHSIPFSLQFCIYIRKENIEQDHIEKWLHLQNICHTTKICLFLSSSVLCVWLGTVLILLPSIIPRSLTWFRPNVNTKFILHNWTIPIPILAISLTKGLQKCTPSQRAQELPLSAATHNLRLWLVYIYLSDVFWQAFQGCLLTFNKSKQTFSFIFSSNLLAFLAFWLMVI